MQIVNTPTTAIALPIGHAHAADLEACLDLINSEEYDDEVFAEGSRWSTCPRSMPRSTTSRSAAWPTRASIRAQAEAAPGGGTAWLSACTRRAPRCARCGTPGRGRGRPPSRRSTP